MLSERRAAVACKSRGVILKTQASDFWVKMWKGVEAESAKLGVKVDLYSAQSEDDLEGQLSILELKIFPFGCYHEMDYNFYYKNIEHNVGVRIKSYFKNMSQT